MAARCVLMRVAPTAVTGFRTCPCNGRPGASAFSSSRPDAGAILAKALAGAVPMLFAFFARDGHPGLAITGPLPSLD